MPRKKKLESGVEVEESEEQETAKELASIEVPELPTPKEHLLKLLDNVPAIPAPEMNRLLPWLAQVKEVAKQL